MISPAVVALLGALAVLLGALEGEAQLRRRSRPRAARLGVNILVGATAMGAAFLTARPAALGLAGWLDLRGYGLLAILPVPRWAAWALGFQRIPIKQIGLYRDERRASWPVTHVPRPTPGGTSRGNGR